MLTRERITVGNWGEKGHIVCRKRENTHPPLLLYFKYSKSRWTAHKLQESLQYISLENVHLHTHNSAHPRAQHHMDGVQDYNLTENLTEFVRA